MLWSLLKSIQYIIGMIKTIGYNHFSASLLSFPSLFLIVIWRQLLNQLLVVIKSIKIPILEISRISLKKISPKPILVLLASKPRIYYVLIIFSSFPAYRSVDKLGGYSKSFPIMSYDYQFYIFLELYFGLYYSHRW